MVNTPSITPPKIERISYVGGERMYTKKDLEAAFAAGFDSSGGSNYVEDEWQKYSQREGIK